MAWGVFTQPWNCWGYVFDPIMSKLNAFEHYAAIQLKNTASKYTLEISL